MRLALGVAIAGALGCGAPIDPCAGTSETCVAVEVYGAFDSVDSLRVNAAVDGRILRGRVESMPPRAFALPVQFAAVIPAVIAGTVTLDLIAVRADAPVARGDVQVTVPPRSQRARVDLTAISGDAGAIDLVVPGDLAAEDLAVSLSTEARSTFWARPTRRRRRAARRQFHTTFHVHDVIHLMGGLAAAGLTDSIESAPLQ